MFNVLKKVIRDRSGSSELLGFTCIAPFILFLICAIIAATQIATTNQALSYCAYNACRSAVVSDSYSVAQRRATEIYTQQFGMDNAIKYGYTPVTLELMSPASATDWGKGKYVKCTVKVHIDTIMPFTSGERTQSIIMMVENG